MPLLPSVVASMVCCVLCCGLLCVLAVCSCCLCVFLVAVCAVCDVLAWLLCVCCLFLGCCPHGLSACLCGLFLFLKKNNKKNGQKGKRLPRYGSTFALLRLAEISSAYNLNPSLGTVQCPTVLFVRFVGARYCPAGVRVHSTVNNGTLQPVHYSTVRHGTVYFGKNNRAQKHSASLQFFSSSEASK